MSRRAIIFIIALVILIVVLISGYEFIANLSYTRRITLPANMLASSSTDSNSNADNGIIASTTLAGTFGLSDPTLMSPASSTVDTSSWRTYSNPASANMATGYSLRYPTNLSVNADSSGNLTLAFPKDQYFHWPLLDDAKITVIASSSCPTVIDDRPNSQPTSLVLNGYSFTRIEGGDVGAGNIYHELAYDTQAGGICYHIDFLDHGANGAGLYVGDQSLIADYDAVHTTDLTTVAAVFNAMVNTFRLTKSVL
jgi:hypothetical protein